MRTWIGAKPALIVGILAMVSVGMVGWLSRAGEGDDSPQGQPSASSAAGAVEADMPPTEVARLDAVARQHPEVAAIAAGSARFELMRAALVHPDTKDVSCGTRESCAVLTYYSWDKAVGITVTVSIATGGIVGDPAQTARPQLTQVLRDKAVDIARRDADVRATIAKGAEVANVVDPRATGRVRTTSARW